MNIGATIKKYRRERDITQEKFAEYLNVSPQAVSRWETGVAYPDITTIPAIATFLGISADILFGIEESKREEQIQEYLREHKRLEATGEIEKRLALSKAAKIAFSGDFRVLRNYAWDLSCSPYQGLDGKCIMSDEELKECFGEVLDLCRIILEDCTDDEIRYSAISLQIMVYKTIDDEPSIKKAVECADRLPHHYNSKHAELARIYGYETEEEILFHQQYTQDLVSTLWSEMIAIVYSQCSIEKKIFVCKKALALHRLIYDNEDYGVEAQTVANIYKCLSRLYLEAKDSDSALDALEKYVEYSLMSFDALDNGFKYTSPLFDHLTFEKGNYSRSFTETPAEFLLHRLNVPTYDIIRETERFQNIIKQLV